jgi:hypothetical protein
MTIQGICRIGSWCRHRGISLAAVAVVGAALLTGGCGTLLGSTSVISLHTNPPGAAAYVDGRLVGRTPIQVRVNTGSSHRIAFRARGYQPVQQTLFRSISAGWVILDILWFPIGIIVDAITGNWGYFPQSVISVNLQPAGHYRAPTPSYGRGGYSQPPGPSSAPPPAANPPAPLPPSGAPPPAP